MSNIMIIIFSVLLTASVMVSLFLLYLLKKGNKEKEEIVSKQQQASSDINPGVDAFKDAFFEQIFTGKSSVVGASSKSGTFRGQPYILFDCPRGSVFNINNKWINDTATHNIKHISEIVEKEEATIVAICKMTVSGPNGTRFVIEDIYGKVTTEPKKFKQDVSANELQGKLVIFKGYIENGKFTLEKISRTKIEVA